jgi:GNAT superfamily N-acetyltransferase
MNQQPFPLARPDYADICVRVETYDEIIDDIKALLPTHWKEIALYQDDIPLDPDYDMYKRVHASGMLVIYAVRRAITKELIGYALYFVRPHLHYAKHRWAISDIFWLAPQYRNFGVGTFLFGFIERDLKEHGVAVMHTTLKTAHPEASFVLENLGHTKIELGYSKRLV